MIVQFQGFEFDFVLKKLTQSGEPKKLDGKAAELLALLVKESGRLVTRQEIRKRLWPDGTNVDFDNRINVYLAQLRAALGDNPQDPKFIRTEKAVGYEFIAVISPVSGDEPASLIVEPPISEEPPKGVQEPARSPLLTRLWLPIAMAILLALGGATLKAVLAGAYWQAIGTLFLFVLYTVVLCAQFEIKSALSRTAIATLVIGAMAYTASASTMPYVTSTVVNASTLKPVPIYPLVTGLKFIPLYVLVFFSWVFLGLTNDKGFAHSAAARWAYIAAGAAFLGATAVGLGGPSGDFQIWHTGLPGHWTLVLGYGAILVLNLLVWVAGYRCFRQGVIHHYRHLFLICALVYLPLTTVAAIVDQQYNEINRFYLDQRRPTPYIAENPEIITSVATNMPSAWKDEVGEELAGLLNDPRFLAALRTQPFYKENFDEPFQTNSPAVMFGYKENVGAAAGSSPFRIIRFPLQLAQAIRFRARETAHR